VIKNNLSSHFEGPVLNLFLSFLNFESLLHVQAGSEKPDPIYSLFMPSPTGVEGMQLYTYIYSMCCNV